MTAPPVGEPAGQPGTEAGSGQPAVDAAVQAVADAADLPPAEQIEAYDAAHRILQETLAAIDQS